MSVHERISTEYTRPELHQLPLRLQKLMCNCGNYTAMTARFESGPPMCGNCDKVVPWFFKKCIECDTYFIQDFRHPKFCGFYPTCWEHTLTQEWEHCETHRSYLWELRYHEIVEPVGLNPKVLSTEELASFDIFADF